MRTKNFLLGLQTALLGLFIFAIEPAVAGIYNPDFQLGLDGWSDASSNGSVVVNAGAATLTAGDGVNPFSAVLVQGDDGSFSFSNPVAISNLATSFEFDLLFLNSIADASETAGSIFGDSLTLSIYDAADSAFDLIFSGLSFSHHSLDISTLAGRNVAFSFELADEDDGFNLALAIDNLSILEQTASTSVPESSPLVLFLLGLSALAFFRRIHKAK